MKSLPAPSPRRAPTYLPHTSLLAAPLRKRTHASPRRPIHVHVTCTCKPFARNRYRGRIGGLGNSTRGVSDGVLPEGRAALPLAWVGCWHPFEGLWRPIRPSTTCAHLGHRAAPRRSKLTTCVGSAGLGARARGQIDVRLVLHGWAHWRSRIKLGLSLCFFAEINRAPPPPP